MSKKWNDIESRETYVLLLTLNNAIIATIFMFLNHTLLTEFLSERFIKYSIKVLIVIHVIRFICVMVCSYSLAKILFTFFEMNITFGMSRRDFDDYKYHDKFSYYKFLKNIYSLPSEKVKRSMIRMSLFTLLWFLATIYAVTRDIALYGTKNPIEQLKSLPAICYDIANDNVVECDIKKPNVGTSLNGMHYVISYWDSTDTELVLTNDQYELLQNNRDAYFHFIYYGSSGFLISIEISTQNMENTLQ